MSKFKLVFYFALTVSLFIAYFVLVSCLLIRPKSNSTHTYFTITYVDVLGALSSWLVAISTSVSLYWVMESLGLSTLFLMLLFIFLTTPLVLSVGWLWSPDSCSKASCLKTSCEEHSLSKYSKAFYHHPYSSSAYIIILLEAHIFELYINRFNNTELKQYNWSKKTCLLVSSPDLLAS